MLADPADTEFLISCEFCEAGSARDSCKSNSINLKSAKGIVRDAAIGLSFIHSNGYIHRDIKPDNILLCSDGSAKVGDFGFVTDKLQFGFATPYGTPVYWAPEVFQTKACSNQSDVYSLGATLLHLVSGDSWFLRDRNRPLVATDPTGQPYLKENPVYLPHVPKDWRTKISKLLRHDSNRRCASMSEAVDLISTLGQVENWNCQVGADSIIWTLENGKRPIFVVWKDYFQKSSTWAAWSESLSGTNKRTLSHDPGNGKWYDSYRSLQSFFQERTDRIR
ncbi:protein kinase domain-containing protein [Shimia thalassica]|uniref:protein kinase domain-containing protein n=1 Tax=Shimia thalassica TaxID=1715693 RepID=UPI00273414F0|nr:protein kinase [Shimia thalassica]MDP2520907.1 protein kinase [Shimia thalassica]